MSVCLSIIGPGGGGPDVIAYGAVNICSLCSPSIYRQDGGWPWTTSLSCNMKKLNSNFYKKQVCIPVGCVPPAYWLTVSRCSGRGACMACTPAGMHALNPPSMHTLTGHACPFRAHPQGMHTSPAMHTPAGTHAPRPCMPPRPCTPIPLGTLPGTHAPQPRTPPVTHAPLWTEFLTHASDNITLP